METRIRLVQTVKPVAFQEKTKSVHIVGSCNNSWNNMNYRNDDCLFYFKFIGTIIKLTRRGRICWDFIKK